MFNYIFGSNILVAKMVLFHWLCHSIKNFVAKFSRRMDFELGFRVKNLKSLHFTPKFSLKPSFTKFQFECDVYDLAIKKTVNLTNFA